MTVYTIDATGKKLGRVASEAAHILRGKNTPDFVPYALSGNAVRITNASKLSITDAKYDMKTYKRFSGYPSGLKEETLRAVVKTKGHGEALRRAILRMLPKNKLRPAIMKQLAITEE